jgi:uncharacterized membrane protein
VNLLVDKVFSSILEGEWSGNMIFLVIGSIFFLIGFVFLILPSKKINFIYGYRSYLAKQNERNWRYAQKICTQYFLLFGGVMTLIGILLEVAGMDQFLSLRNDCHSLVYCTDFWFDRRETAAI